ncbi:MAG TPA: right-handed parallel beta-helix repeat-containing protein [Candidatus Acidoferrum sp.]|nr:right-handed parallel beta-helix repeat-containing protein [Candidatus Acidoferrum sp.]
MKRAFVLLALLNLCGIATARTLHVPSEYATLADAWAALQRCDDPFSTPCDTIQLAPGVYSGAGFVSFDVGSRCVAIVGARGADKSVIDLQGGQFLKIPTGLPEICLLDLKFTAIPSFDSVNGNVIDQPSLDPDVRQLLVSHGCNSLTKYFYGQYNNDFAKWYEAGFLTYVNGVAICDSLEKLPAIEKTDLQPMSYSELLQDVTLAHGSTVIQSDYRYRCTKFKHCSFDSNTIALSLNGYADFIFDSCRFEHNNTGIYTYDEISIAITDCLFHGNGWATSCLMLPSLSITNSAFVSNGIGVEVTDANGMDLTHNLFYHNFFGVEEPYYMGDTSYYPGIACNMFADNFRNFEGYLVDVSDTLGNFSRNPHFCDTTQSWSRVADVSPLLPSNNDCHVLIANAVSACGCCFGTVGNIDYDDANSVDIGDLSTLVDYLFFAGPIACQSEADIDRSSSVDIADLTGLIDYLFGTGWPLPQCL